MKYKITYSIPFSPDPELREKLFEEVISATNTQSAREQVFKKHPTASIKSLVQVSFI